MGEVDEDAEPVHLFNEGHTERTKDTEMSKPRVLNSCITYLSPLCRGIMPGSKPQESANALWHVWVRVK